MNFRTMVPVQEGFPKINHSSGVFLLGSCFVENIGQKLEWFKYRNLQNPIGIIFHPSPIKRFLERVAAKERYAEVDIFEFNDGWQSLEAHSLMRRSDEQACLQDLNESLEEAYGFLENCQHLIVSLGTAWGYRNLEDGKVAANCHKLPQKLFSKELSNIEGIYEDLKGISIAVRSINPGIKLIFTVSPVRHLKDGMVENQQSKAHLIAAVHQFIKEEGITKADYFPSYEILMDELRDYRFYSKDMLHPNELAVDYIWKLFSESWIDKKSLKLNSEIDKIQKALFHRVRAENTKEHKKFLTKIKGKIEEIHKKYPEITFS